LAELHIVKVKQRFGVIWRVVDDWWWSLNRQAQGSRLDYGIHNMATGAQISKFPFKDREAFLVERQQPCTDVNDVLSRWITELNTGISNFLKSL